MKKLLQKYYHPLLRGVALFTVTGCVISIASAISFATTLSEADIQRLAPQKHMEHVLYEVYMESDKGPISVLGYHFDSFINNNIYYVLAIFGAIEGERGGYGIASLGIGYRTRITNNLYFDSKVMVGSGGGGGVPAGGGLNYEYMAGISYELLKDIFLDIKYGRLNFTTGTFNSPVYNIGLSFEYSSLVFK